MPPGSSETAKPRALFLSPEAPEAGTGGGGLRSASLLEYLRTKYEVEVVGFDLRKHARNFVARGVRNARRVALARPPLLDRFSGYEQQLAARLNGEYEVAVVEHFWCAPYARLLRQRAKKLVLDLHNIESELAETHARAVNWPVSPMFRRFAGAYRELEREWIPQFDLVLATSEDDRLRIEHPRVAVFPNALPELARPAVGEEDAIAFSGNLEYHPNVAAVRWLCGSIWPGVWRDFRSLELRLIGRNPDAVRSVARASVGVKLVGPVKDAVEELARAQVCVVPLLSGSGTRFKILEAWAARRAVVSTTIGAEGLGAIDGEHLLIADDSPAFADAVRRLLRDPGLRSNLGAAGRELYLERFTWRSAWRALEKAGL